MLITVSNQRKNVTEKRIETTLTLPMAGSDLYAALKTIQTRAQELCGCSSKELYLMDVEAPIRGIEGWYDEYSNIGNLNLLAYVVEEYRDMVNLIQAIVDDFGEETFSEIAEIDSPEKLINIIYNINIFPIFLYNAPDLLQWSSPETQYGWMLSDQFFSSPESPFRHSFDSAGIIPISLNGILGLLKISDYFDYEGFGKAWAANHSVILGKSHYIPKDEWPQFSKEYFQEACSEAMEEFPQAQLPAEYGSSIF